MSVTAAALSLSVNSSKRKEDEKKFQVSIKKSDSYGVVGSVGQVSVLTMQSQF